MICVKKSCDLITAARLLRLSDRAEQKIQNTCTSLFEVVPGMINFLYSLSMSLREHLSSALLKMLYKKYSVFKSAVLYKSEIIHSTFIAPCDLYTNHT